MKTAKVRVQQSTDGSSDAYCDLQKSWLERRFSEFKQALDLASPHPSSVSSVQTLMYVTLSLESLQKIPQLVIDRVVGHGVSDLAAEFLLKPALEPLDGHLRRGFGGTELQSERFVTTRWQLAHQAVLELLELGCLALRFPFRSNSPKDLIEDGKRPVPIEHRFRRALIDRLKTIPILRVV